MEKPSSIFSILMKYLTKFHNFYSVFSLNLLRTFTQVSGQWQDTDSMREELDDLQVHNCWPLDYYETISLFYYWYILFQCVSTLYCVLIWKFQTEGSLQLILPIVLLYLQIFLSTRWAILLNLHVEMFRVNKYPLYVVIHTSGPKWEHVFW